MTTRLRTAALLITVLFLCLLVPAVQAAGTDVWISPDGTLTPDAIVLNKNEGRGFTLYLPGYLKLEDMKFGLADGVTFSWNGQEIRPGDSAEIIAARISEEPVPETGGETAKETESGAAEAEAAPGKEEAGSGDGGETQPAAGEESAKNDPVPIRIGRQDSTVLVMRGSENLPAVFVTTESGSLKKIESNKEKKEPGRLVLRGPDGAVQYDGTLESVKCRGNSSMTFKKKNYQIKLEKSTNLLGMGKAKKWILTGNYRDRSYLRNQIVLDLAAAVGLAYTPEHTPAELYINHEYRGLYLFSEKVEIDKDRVAVANLENATKKLNIDPPDQYRIFGNRESTKGSFKAYDIPRNPADITGGYLVEYESYPVRYQKEASAYTTDHGSILVLKSPEYATVAQMEYISSLFQSFEDAVMADDGKDPGSGKHYTDIADAESLALKYMIEEFSQNYDGNSSSQYFYKPQDSRSTKIFAGPCWDYDSSFGSYATKRSAKYVLNPARLWIAKGSNTAWYTALYRHQDFRDLVADLWQDRFKSAVEVLLGTGVSVSGNLRSLDRWQEIIRDSAAMDRKRWPRPAVSNTIAQTGGSFDQNIDFLKDYIQKRYDFLNETWVRGK